MTEEEFFEGNEIRAAVKGADVALTALGIDLDGAALARVTLSVLLAFERAGGFAPDMAADFSRITREAFAEGLH